MDRRVRIIVECEDALHRSFVTRFLREIGLPEGKRPEINPRGPKSAVLNEVPRAVRAVRNANVKAHLIIVVDGDNWTEETVDVLINRRLEANDLAPLTPADRVLVVVIGRRMDTWIRHLRGEGVDEVQGPAGNPGHKLADDSAGRGSAAHLAAHCKNNQPLPNPLPSLVQACNDWQAYRKRHGL